MIGLSSTDFLCQMHPRHRWLSFSSASLNTCLDINARKLSFAEIITFEILANCNREGIRSTVTRAGRNRPRISVVYLVSAYQCGALWCLCCSKLGPHCQKDSRRKPHSPTASRSARLHSALVEEECYIMLKFQYSFLYLGILLVC